jgi:hypothetical protein
MPMNSSAPETNEALRSTHEIDKENAFLLYATFCGDAERTAHALDVSPETIKAMAEGSGWDKKLRPIIELKQSSKPGDIERGVNRALNFVQAHRYRLFLERVLRQLTGLSGSDLEAFLFPQEKTKGKAGLDDTVTQKFTTRALADLASAVEKCHLLTYLALNDTATERKERKDDTDDSVAAAELHVRLARAMSEAGGASKSIKGIVADAQLAIAQDAAVVDLKAPDLRELPADGV